MYPHRIRLRGPWECERIEMLGHGLPTVPPLLRHGRETVPPARRVLMPCRWIDAGLADFHGNARFTRRFGYPGNIDESEHVWLTCDGCTGCREVWLNGELLAEIPGETFAFDVTQRLSLRNRLDVLIQGDTDDAGLWDEVALEIRKDAFLADAQIERTATAVHLIGKAYGTSPQPLELYVLVDGRHVDYRTISPTAAGTPFRIELAGVTDESQFVRAELIHVSSIWYVIEIPISR